MPSGLPDLTLTHIEVLRPPGCGVTDEILLEVCVANVGSGDAGPFSIEARSAFEVFGLRAGQEQCLVQPFPYLVYLNVDVDPRNEIEEADEDNNVLLINPALPSSRVTCTPTATPTRSPRPTAT